MAPFRHVYDLAYNDLFEDSDTKLQFLANVYLAADKYQIEGLQANAIKHMETIAWTTEGNWESGPTCIPIDFLAATKIIFNGTTKQDDACRVALVNFCVLCIGDFQTMPEFYTLLSECGDLGAAIIAHGDLGVMLQGYWDCEGEIHRAAVPRCPDCDFIFSKSDVRQHRGKRTWRCTYCRGNVKPVCSDRHSRRLECEWLWV